MQNYEAQVLVQVESIRVVVDHLGRSNIILNIGSPDINANLDFTATTPPSDDATTIPLFSFSFHAYHNIAYMDIYDILVVCLFCDIWLLFLDMYLVTSLVMYVGYLCY